jgi:hypothetical protein
MKERQLCDAKNELVFPLHIGRHSYMVEEIT